MIIFVILHNLLHKIEKNSALAAATPCASQRNLPSVPRMPACILLLVVHAPCHKDSLQYKRIFKTLDAYSGLGLGNR
jgi:hypothetical protein